MNKPWTPPPIPPRQDDYLLIDPLPEPPIDMGDLVNISLLGVGKTYVLATFIRDGSKRYQYVTVTAKTRVITDRYALELDILNRNKKVIAHRGVRLLNNQNNTVFYKLKTEALSKAIGSKATRQAIDEVYEGKTGQSAAPGTGPADLIRGFVGVQPPKNAKGRKTRRRHIQRSLRRNRSRRNR
jgi:hypothetical protein